MSVTTIVAEDGCNCCGGLIFDCLTRCPDGITECWELTVAGIVNNNCPCDIFNGTFTLIPRSPLKCFRESDEEGNGLGSGIWTLQHVGNILQLLATIFGDATCGTYGTRAYEIGEDDFDCTGANILVRQGSADTGNCNQYPPTLTVVPVECP